MGYNLVGLSQTAFCSSKLVILARKASNYLFPFTFSTPFFPLYWRGSLPLFRLLILVEAWQSFARWLSLPHRKHLFSFFHFSFSFGVAPRSG